MKSLSYLIAILFIIFLSSCKDLIEQDITHSRLNIISPADNLLSNSYDVTFWWDKLKGAQKYRLQVVRPTFDSLEKIFIDTAVTENKIQLNLLPGKYQWRIRIENGSSNSAFIVRNITVDTNVVLTSQNFLVDYPLDKIYSNSKVMAFSWQSFPFADVYEYALTDSNNVPIRTKRTSNTSITDTLPEGKFHWKVRAINSANNTMTLFSGTRSFYIDFTNPSFSTNLDPLDLSSVSNPVKLSWTHADDAYADSIIIASDSNFTTVTHRHFVTGTELSLQPLTINSTYFWKIRSKDKAGNWSSFTPHNRFTISP